MGIGDWVCYVGENEKLFGSFGFITYIGNYNIGVYFSKDCKGNNLRFKKMVNKFDLMNIERMVVLDKQDYETLVDLALGMDDLDWCKELNKKYKGGY